MTVPGSSPLSPTPLLDYYDGRAILVVGGSGLVGTVVCWKLATCSKVKQIYVLVRGGEEYVLQCKIDIIILLNVAASIGLSLFIYCICIP